VQLEPLQDRREGGRQRAEKTQAVLLSDLTRNTAEDGMQCVFADSRLHINIKGEFCMISVT
jgi:hypothetical protein